MDLIGFVGWKSSGKNSAALALRNHNFTNLSFGSALKDALAVMFIWDRNLLEGDTPESREWRETVDEWWSTKLGISNFTPRFAMTHFGTQIIREKFHNDLWTLNMERQIDREISSGNNVSITDIRFQNEYNLAKRKNGKVFWIKKGDDPEWLDIGILAASGDLDSIYEMNRLGIHETEYAWLNLKFDGIIHNNSTMEDLHSKVLDFCGIRK